MSGCWQFYNLLSPAWYIFYFRTYSEVEKEVAGLACLFPNPIKFHPIKFPDGSLEFNASLQPAPFVDLKLSNLSNDSLYNTACDQDHISALFRGLFTLSGDWTVDLYHFEPCGFSLNAVERDGRRYATIHVTPEAKFSYASFECNDMHLLLREIEFIVQLFGPGNMDVSLCWPDKSAKRAFVKKIMKYMDLKPGKPIGKKVRLYQFTRKF